MAAHFRDIINNDSIANFTCSKILNGKTKVPGGDGGGT